MKMKDQYNFHFLFYIFYNKYYNPADILVLKVNNENVWWYMKFGNLCQCVKMAMCEICSKLTKKTPEQRQ